MFQAYILVNKVGFTYKDIKRMNRIERLMFIKFLADESEKFAKDLNK